MSRSPGRQEPRQARSRDMVERILLAAAQVLAERGYAGLSTNRVAEVADVSVGSLYRYFHDKDDLIERLRERSTAEVMEALGEGMSEAIALPTRDAVRHIVAVLVAGIQRHGAVISALVNEVPLGSHGNVLPGLERQLAHLTRMFVVTHAPDLAPAEAEARIYLAMGVTLTTCLRIALEPPPGITEDRLIDLTAELLEVGLVLA